MKTRRAFLNYLMASVTAILTALFAISCGAKPDVETEPSPEWPPKE
jgi:hypothetical protein